VSLVAVLLKKDDLWIDNFADATATSSMNTYICLEQTPLSIRCCTKV